MYIIEEKQFNILTYSLDAMQVYWNMKNVWDFNLVF
jgi:hypothetical protein